MIRTIVRYVFWTTVLLGAGLATEALGRAISALYN
jgi:hypothetical protein